MASSVSPASASTACRRIERDIGVVFQNYALFPHMTVGENVAFPLKMRRPAQGGGGDAGAPRARHGALGSFEARRPSQLSGGQQQRVALARALVFEPKLVLMDEPLGALDKQLREHMQLEIKHLHARLGITVVYVTHDQSEALTMSDRVAVFNDGAIAAGRDARRALRSAGQSVRGDFHRREQRDRRRSQSRCWLTRCRIRTSDGSVIEALAGDGLKQGAKTTLVLRPERIVLAPEGAGFNRFPAKIEELIYHGDHLRLRVSACGTSDVCIKLSAGAPGIHAHAGRRDRDWLAARALPGAGSLLRPAPDTADDVHRLRIAGIAMQLALCSAATDLPHLHLP